MGERIAAATAAVFLCWQFVLPPAAGSAAAGAYTCGQPKNDGMLFCLPTDYSKFEPPLTDSPVIVTVMIDIDDVLSINERDYSITFSSYFNIKWQDKRILLKPGFGQEQARYADTADFDLYVPVSLGVVDELWLPNIFIYNLEKYEVSSVLRRLAGVWMNTGHEVLYSQATRITVVCNMRFHKFPLDSQHCKFQVGSYSYDDSRMLFVTDRAGYLAPKTNNSIALEYSVKIKSLEAEDQVFLGGSLGNFSLAGFEMVLGRYKFSYLVNCFLPSGLFVVASWVSFLIPPDAVAGRTGLLLLLFLVLVNIFNTIASNIPKAEGLTLIESWMLFCILFVFGALVE